MGVPGLLKYAKSQSTVYTRRKNILDEIEMFKKYENNPLIIFDMMGFVHIFGKTSAELNLGGRYNIYLKQFDTFLSGLKNAGATLLFCCDGQLQTVKVDEWCSRRNTDYRDSMKLLDGNYTTRRFGCKSIMKDLMKLIKDKEFGEIVISTDRDCDTIAANYAISQNALAIVASDSDYLIFGGSFRLWQVSSLKLDTFEVDSFDRCALRNHFNLSNDQMKALSTIAGNDYSKTILSTQPWNWSKNTDFMVIANFCRTIKGEFNDDAFKKIAKFMNKNFDKCEASLTNYVNCIEESINFYDVNFELPTTPNINADKMKEYYIENVLMYALFTQKIFQYDMNFVDLKHRSVNNNSEYFVDALLNVFRKLGGILLMERKGDTDILLKICTKYTHHNGYELKEHLPIYPEKEEFFELEDLIFGPGALYHEIRWNLLLWVLDLDQQYRFYLENIPKEYVLIVLALTFLVKAEKITIREADALLASEFDVIEKYVETNDIECVFDADTETIRIGQLYTRAITLIWDCLYICGLKQFISVGTYDGFYHAEIKGRMQRSTTFYNEAIEQIQLCRLYQQKYWNLSIDKLN